MMADAKTVVVVATEMLGSINLLVGLIAKANLTHAERKGQLELLSEFITAQQERFSPALTPEPTLADLVVGQDDKAAQWVEGVRMAMKQSGDLT